jgi:SulP family sulfate permease
LALIVVFFAKLLAFIPVSALAGLMLVVAVKTFEWKETRDILRSFKESKQSFFDALSMITTTILCLKSDMSIGVIVGAVVSFLPAIYGKVRKVA